MTKSKHTRGPWKLDHRSKYKVHISAQKWSSLAKVIVRMKDDETDTPEGLANARIIAAAPNLYDAVLNLLHLVGRGEDEREQAIVDDARAAIAMAERP